MATNANSVFITCNKMHSPTLDQVHNHRYTFHHCCSYQKELSTNHLSIIRFSLDRVAASEPETFHSYAYTVSPDTLNLLQ